MTTNVFQPLLLSDIKMQRTCQQSQAFLAHSFRYVQDAASPQRSLRSLACNRLHSEKGSIGKQLEVGKIFGIHNRVIHRILNTDFWKIICGLYETFCMCVDAVSSTVLYPYAKVFGQKIFLKSPCSKFGEWLYRSLCNFDVTWLSWSWHMGGTSYY